MSELNKGLNEKLEACPSDVRKICRETVLFAQSMPEVAVKEHLDALIRKAIKKGESHDS